MSVVQWGIPVVRCGVVVMLAVLNVPTVGTTGGERLINPTVGEPIVGVVIMNDFHIVRCVKVNVHPIVWWKGRMGIFVNLVVNEWRKSEKRTLCYILHRIHPVRDSTGLGVVPAVPMKGSDTLE